MKKVLVIGAGLAGCEASYYLAKNNIKVILVENKGLKRNPAQKVSTFAELVCTNSLKSMNPHSGHGLLKTEMKAMGSLVLEVAEATKVPAGDALAVDREKFSTLMTERLKAHENIEIIEREASDPLKLQDLYQCDATIIATGPLTTNKLSDWIKNNISSDDFYFYDAIAPVVDADSLDYSKLYFKDRHKEAHESADYLNAPMSEDEYYRFVDELRKAQKVPAQSFEEYKFFEACLPIDIMAERGVDTPRFSCMKPIGLEREVEIQESLETSESTETFDEGSDTKTLKKDEQPFAVVQLRKENLLGSAFNLVGFQTRLTYKEQVRVFRTIPGFEQATFIHLGSVHRNSFLNAAKLLSADLSSKKFPNLYFAGQISGVEGYTESASMGLYVAGQVLNKLLLEKEPLKWPVETGMGALVNYLMTVPRPAPSSINFGLLPSVLLDKKERKSKDRKKIKKEKAAKRAQEALINFSKDNPRLFC